MFGKSFSAARLRVMPMVRIKRLVVIAQSIPTKESRDLHELGVALELVLLLQLMHGLFLGEEVEAGHPGHGRIVHGAVGVVLVCRNELCRVGVGSGGGERED